MNHYFVRVVDYFVGIPLCWMLSVANRVIRAFRSRFLQETKTEVKKALFIELSEMGNAILAYPSIKKLQTSVPEIDCYFVVFERNKEGVSLLGCIDEDKILVIRDNNFFLFIWDIINIFFVRRPTFDICFDLELFSRCTSILSFLSGARSIIGFHAYYSEGLYRGNFLTNKVNYNPYRHMSLNYYSLVSCALQNISGLPIDRITYPEGSLSLPVYSSQKKVRENLIAKLRTHNSEIDVDHKIVVINPHPGKYLPIRAWGIDNYTELTRYIIDKTEAYVVIVGLPEARFIGDRMASKVTDRRCINFIGETESLSELVELFSFSEVLVTNDSGPGHIACLTAINILALFGPETPLLYGPMSKNCKIFYTPLQCSPCLSALNHKWTTCRDNKCLKSILPEDVFGHVESVLKEGMQYCE